MSFGEILDRERDGESERWWGWSREEGVVVWLCWSSCRIFRERKRSFRERSERKWRREREGPAIKRR